MSGGGFGWGGAARGMHLPGQVQTGRLRGEQPMREPKQVDIAALVQAEIARALKQPAAVSAPVNGEGAEFVYAQQQASALLDIVDEARNGLDGVLSALVELHATLTRFVAGAELASKEPEQESEHAGEV